MIRALSKCKVLSLDKFKRYYCTDNFIDYEWSTTFKNKSGKIKKSVLTGQDRSSSVKPSNNLEFLNKHGLLMKGIIPSEQVPIESSGIIDPSLESTIIIERIGDDIDYPIKKLDTLNNLYDENGDNVVVMDPSFEKKKSTRKKKPKEPKEENVYSETTELSAPGDQPKPKRKTPKRKDTTVDNLQVKESKIEEVKIDQTPPLDMKPLKLKKKKTVVDYIINSDNIKNYSNWLYQIKEYNIDIGSNYNNSNSKEEEVSISSGNESYSKQFEWDRVVSECNKMVFGNDSFRRLQKEAINAILSNKDTFISLPTGGGKSLCFQLPALIGKDAGVNIVISPLLALMQDQLSKLKSLGVPVETLNSQLSISERKRVFQELNNINCSIKLLYVTPERFSGSDFQEILVNIHDRGQLKRLIVDEAHSISEWGHDFRPSYRRLSLFRKQFPGLPIVALTATATDRVEKDIKSSLQMRSIVNIRSSFMRSNLIYQVRLKSQDSQSVLTDIYAYISKKYPKESGIIYCATTKDCEIISEYLSSRGLDTCFYHASLKPSQRIQLQNDWTEGRFKVVCTTIAFGMGIDKSNTRFVIHHTIPQSIEAYYQQTGRAGRDGQTSDCILYYSKFDLILLKKLMANSDKRTKLSKEPFQDEVYPDETDEDPEEILKQLQANKNDMLDNMVSFCVNTKECRRVSLLKYFSEQSKPCKTNCDNCISPHLPHELDQSNTQERVYSRFSYQPMKKKKKSNKNISYDDVDD
ncbi:ATP-dependent DNA helicase RecQ family protein [Tieghemostelium lacteum]|uniref:ATP-dependent DNA helicase n=1 Tax=Tieghemostelium lacteum TaxID=361077 RepID=G8FUF7_TIELA|nr:ATP-dependent DNA helicase [Tieghemostelium lacteum]KYR01670.1 ATP-dependent DNA helicase RecQ family protein [Tieghemostelium lacteum]|eukprot:KYR01670.1 ATP-dependent DNA helicase RecQ family protein [Tieghemostelium lacteum]